MITYINKKNISDKLQFVMLSHWVITCYLGVGVNEKYDQIQRLLLYLVVLFTILVVSIDGL